MRLIQCLRGPTSPSGMVQRRAERLAEIAEHFFGRVEGNAADQQQLIRHAHVSSACEIVVQTLHYRSVSDTAWGGCDEARRGLPWLWFAHWLGFARRKQRRGLADSPGAV